MKLFLGNNTRNERGVRIYELEPLNTDILGAADYDTWRLPIDSELNSSEEARSVNLRELATLAYGANFPYQVSFSFSGNINSDINKNIFGNFSPTIRNMKIDVLSVGISVARPSTDRALIVELGQIDFNNNTPGISFAPLSGSRIEIPENVEFHRANFMDGSTGITSVSLPAVNQSSFLNMNNYAVRVKHSSPTQNPAGHITVTLTLYPVIST